MPAIEDEIIAAEQEGIRLHVLTTPTKVIGQGGKVAGLECVRMEMKEFDRSGRRTPKPVEGSAYSLEVDTVIEAIGQRPDSGFGIKSGPGGTISAAKRTLATERPGVFAGGDAARDPQTVIEAIADGQRAASSIKQDLEGRAPSPVIERNHHRPIALSSKAPTEEETKEKPRIRAPEIAMSERKASFKERPWNIPRSRQGKKPAGA